MEKGVRGRSPRENFGILNLYLYRKYISKRVRERITEDIKNHEKIENPQMGVALFLKCKYGVRGGGVLYYANTVISRISTSGSKTLFWFRRDWALALRFSALNTGSPRKALKIFFCWGGDHDYRSREKVQFPAIRGYQNKTPPPPSPKSLMN